MPHQTVHALSPSDMTVIENVMLAHLTTHKDMQEELSDIRHLDLPPQNAWSIHWDEHRMVRVVEVRRFEDIYPDSYMVSFEDNYLPSDPQGIDVLFSVKRNGEQLVVDYVGRPTIALDRLNPLDLCPDIKFRAAEGKLVGNCVRNYQANLCGKRLAESPTHQFRHSGAFTRLVFSDRTTAIDIDHGRRSYRLMVGPPDAASLNDMTYMVTVHSDLYDIGGSMFVVN